MTSRDFFFLNFIGISCYFDTCFVIYLILDLNIEQIFNIVITCCQRLQSSLFIITERSCLSEYGAKERLGTQQLFIGKVSPVLVEQIFWKMSILLNVLED